MTVIHLSRGLSMRWGPTFLCVALLLVTGQQASAQTVSGRLLESDTERPLLLGRIVLVDTTFAIVQETMTDHNGLFTLVAPEPGSYWVGAERIGYWPAVDGLAVLEEGGFLPIDFYLRPKPLELEGLTVTARRRRVVQKLTRSGYYDRFEAGFGHFITPEEIEERQPFDIPELLQGTPGVITGTGGVEGDYLLLRGRGRSAFCQPRIYVDGMLLASEQMAGSYPSIEELVQVYDVVGVEVYAGAATVPLAWGGSEGNCGTVIFWTESGG